MSTSDKTYGFTFNGRHSSEFGIRILDTKQVTLPQKRKSLIQLPYSSKQVDLSNVYGENVYDERTITFPCKIAYGREDPYELYSKVTQITRWLYQPIGKSLLRDDAMPNYAFMGEVQVAPTLEENYNFSKLTITFQCDAYRLKKRFDDVWDPFSFDLDAAQETEFDVKEFENLMLINTGDREAELSVECENPVDLILNDQRYHLQSGVNSTVINENLILPKGESLITIVGNGKVSFDWTEEVI